MKNFNWEEFKDEYEKIAVHCDTEEKANDFLQKCHNVGMTWCGGDNTLEYNNWNYHKESTCYTSGVYYSHLNYYKKENYKIIEWEIENSFTLNDIKPFYLVELMNDDLYIVCEIQNGVILKNILNDSYFCMDSYNNKFENILELVKDYNIKKVYGFSEKVFSCLDSFKNDNRPLLWERKEEIKEMSLEEIENILGYKVKIVLRETL